MKVLHFTTHNEACGIGKYQEGFVAAMSGRTDVENRVFDVSPNVIRGLSKADYDTVMERLVAEIADVDILHIQHEWGFFSRDELVRAIDGAHKHGKKAIVTVHTAPGAVDLGLRGRQGLGPRALVAYARARKVNADIQRNRIDPLLRADQIIVHNDVARDGLLQLGVSADRIIRVTLPLQELHAVTPSNVIRQQLNANDGDVILCTVGFIHRLKGIDAAIKVLPYLPENYKLAIIGGTNPSSHEADALDHYSDLIRDLGLIDRVIITGYIESDDELNSLVRECNIALFPYDNQYYSQVSSAALNIALANGMMTAAYPIATFRELNAVADCLELTSSFSYYELARTVRTMPTEWPNQRALDYATRYSYASVGETVLKVYAANL